MSERNAYLSIGGRVIVVIAVLSAVAVALWPIPRRSGLEFWTFAKNHSIVFGPQIDVWNEQADGSQAHLPVQLFVVEGRSLTRRTLSAFWADTPVADLIEIERNLIGNFVSGPIEDVGFVDLTDRLRDEGYLDQINQPSFSPWTSRGRIFGIPHDVHPVLFWYRADIVEQAGIDVSEIETWGDFVRVLGPLMVDLDGDGTVDRYLFNLWYTGLRPIETLLMQAGGGTFDSNGELIVASEANAVVLAAVVRWCYGPQRIAMDAPDLTPAGNYARIQGQVLGGLMPDWLAGVYKTDLPQLAGKIKLMPLPAWEPGGRRTSVMGGTMLGIPKKTEHFEAAWSFAKHLYLSQEMAHALYQNNTIVTPVRKYWRDSIYDQPDPFFSGQAIGRMYIEQAPYVPLRTSSPMRSIARTRIGEAINELVRYARDNNTYDAQSLLPVARRLLDQREQMVRREMQRNMFVRGQKP